MQKQQIYIQYYVLYLYEYMCWALLQEHWMLREVCKSMVAHGMGGGIHTYTVSIARESIYASLYSYCIVLYRPSSPGNMLV